ncbi:hypothetical protein SD71_16295 [Cohnella kolymensis]|uniref:Uncharacterized protein n=1 Tax=Cohnella kolymensis TaxID=1590652 RepID=A0ABR5A2M1_9BACL|nr:hypothetical protein [Cohnella kolymensis]KIL35182.1 hypothetical protein SD71_16295 [Cohnella kolymensis]
MAEIKKRLDISVNIDQPIEEIKECIIAISIFHGPQQLDILREVELWLGKTISDAENKQKEANKQSIGDPAE